MPRRHRVEVYQAAEALVAAQVRPATGARQLMEKFKISERQAHRYIAKVYDDLAAEEEAHRPRRKHQLRQSFSAVFQKAMKSGDMKAAVAALDRLAKLDGLYAPAEVRVDQKHVHTIREKTSDEKRKRLDELLGARFAAPPPVAERPRVQPAPELPEDSTASGPPNGNGSTTNGNGSSNPWGGIN